MNINDFKGLTNLQFALLCAQDFAIQRLEEVMSIGHLRML